MLGKEAEYDRVPYFFTDQYDLGMEYVGYATGDTKGWSSAATSDGREFIAFWLAGGRVLAGMNVNIWDVLTTSRPWSARRSRSTPIGWPTAPLR